MLSAQIPIDLRPTGYGCRQPAALYQVVRLLRRLFLSLVVFFYQSLHRTGAQTLPKLNYYY